MLEQKEKIDSDILGQVAAILKIPAEAIRNFDEEKAVNIIANTFQDIAFENSFNNGTINFHPVEKIIPDTRRKNCFIRADVEGEG